MTIELLAPAKINLGLEVIRKRDDGFHDIATVFQTISVFDRLRIERAERDAVELVDCMVSIESNLAERALQLAQAHGITSTAHRIEIRKRIPIASGMGGASADAAAVLRGFAPDDSAALTDLALQIGSDVPFLLRGGAALARGRGEVIETLPSLRDCWFVLVCPAIELERKTARLYGALETEDFSDGSRVERVAQALMNSVEPMSGDLGNAFSRPLANLLPQVSETITELQSAGAPFVALSGAGPTHYTIVPTLQQAIGITSALAKGRSTSRRVLIARPVPSGLQVRRDKTQPASSAL